MIAVEHLGGVGVGVTAPQFFRADDDKVYVVKLQSNRLGSKVLISEILAARFGEFMNLCFPPNGIIHISKEICEKNQELAASGIMPGQHFASLYLSNCEYVSKHNINNAANLSEMAGIILFDHMFHNADRTNNRKNLLMHKENDQYKIYAIDNSHLFRTGRWTLSTLDNLSTRLRVYYRNTFSILLKDILSPKDFFPYADKVKALSNEEIDKMVNDIPDEWVSDEFLPQALSKFIRTRRDMVDEILDRLYGCIPKSHGGRRWF